MSKKTGSSASEIARKVVSALEALALHGDGPEPVYLVLEQAHVQILVDVIQNVTAIKDIDVITKRLDEIKEYAEELMRGADSLSLEEKETVMEEVLKHRRKSQTS